MPVFSGEIEVRMLVLIPGLMTLRENGFPQFDPGRDILSDFFEEPVNFYAIAVDNNPATDSGWNTNYIGYESTSISDSNGFFADSNLSDGPWLWKMKTEALHIVPIFFHII